MQCALELSLAEQHVEEADRQLLARQALALMQSTARPSAEDAAGDPHGAIKEFEPTPCVLYLLLVAAVTLCQLQSFARLCASQLLVGPMRDFGICFYKKAAIPHYDYL